MSSSPNPRHVVREADVGVFESSLLCEDCVVGRVGRGHGVCPLVLNEECSIIQWKKLVSAI